MPVATPTVPYPRLKRRHLTDPPPARKRIRLSYPSQQEKATAYWNALSRHWLTRSALEELDRRNNQTSSSVQFWHNPGAVAVDKYTTDPLKRLSRNGGPDLRDLRGVPRASIICLPQLTLPGSTRRHSLPTPPSSRCLRGHPPPEQSPIPEIPSKNLRREHVLGVRLPMTRISNNIWRTTAYMGHAAKNQRILSKSRAISPNAGHPCRHRNSLTTHSTIFNKQAMRFSTRR